MSLTDIFKYQLIDTKNYTLMVYQVLIAALILFGVVILLRFIRRLLRREEQLERIEIGKSRAIYQIIKYAFWIFGILLALSAVNVKLTFFVASSAALMVGLGLGLQDIFKDFVSGIVLLVEGSLKVGDVVQTSENQVGIVKQIGLRTSTIETRDNITLLVPNSKLINEALINWSHNEKKTRFDVKVGVAYGSDVQLVKEILLQCAEESVANNPKSIVRLTDFADSSLNFELLFWTVNTFRVEDIKSDLRFSIDAAFRKNGVTIPFPQRDVHFYPADHGKTGDKDKD